MINDLYEITLCGSTRARKNIDKMNEELTGMGLVVYSLGVFRRIPDMDDASATAEQKRLKEMLTNIHFAKVDRADLIFVIDELDDGTFHIGRSTQAEIARAKERGIGMILYSTWKEYGENSDRKYTHIAKVLKGYRGVSPVHVSRSTKINADKSD